MRKVITYGTFDLFHRGHYNILKRAKECGDYLIVGVTGENYDAERGKLSVQDALSKRIENVRATGFADEIIVEEYLGQKISDIIKHDVDVLVIGSDWRGKFDHLRKYCEVVYLERTKDISSTQLREDNLKIYKFGIATDTLYDNDAVIEPKSVSGIHVESVYAKDATLAEQFVEKYELDKGYVDYDKFLESVDIVYIKTGIETRSELIENAIKAKKHVICDVPFSMDSAEVERLLDFAVENDVILLANVPTLYLQSFEQLSWMARGNLIGDLVNVKCSMSKRGFNSLDEKTIEDIAFYPICAVIKLLGIDYKACNCKAVKDEEGNIIYYTISLEYDNCTSFIEIGLDLQVEDGMVIFGTEGMMYVPDDWWNLGYFKLKNKSDNRFKRYSFNFDGNGFRYMIRSLLHMLKKEQVVGQRLSVEEYKAVVKALNLLKK